MFSRQIDWFYKLVVMIWREKKIAREILNFCAKSCNRKRKSELKSGALQKSREIFLSNHNARLFLLIQSLKLDGWRCLTKLAISLWKIFRQYRIKLLRTTKSSLLSMNCTLKVRFSKNVTKLWQNHPLSKSQIMWKIEKNQIRLPVWKSMNIHHILDFGVKFLWPS